METVKKEVVEVVEVVYTIKLNQSELNTITLLLGRSTDEMVEQLARNSGVVDYCINSRLVELYSEFKKNFYTTML